jgi:hypothetical protein
MIGFLEFQGPDIPLHSESPLVENHPLSQEAKSL